MKAYCRFTKCASFGDLRDRELVMNREDLDTCVQRCLPVVNVSLEFLRRIIYLEDASLTLKVRFQKRIFDTVYRHCVTEFRCVFCRLLLVYLCCR